MKKGLVMEGGAMRGMFTAGVTDVFLENGIEFDGEIGVSAGATFGSNFKSKQIGRVIRYNKKAVLDYRYGSIKSLLLYGNIFEIDYCFHQLPFVIDPYDTETFLNNPMEFWICSSDAVTGKPFYKKIESLGPEDVEWVRASATIPMISEPVEINGHYYFDGSMTDSIPLEFFESLGYDKNVVIMTRPRDYRKKPSKIMAFSGLFLKKYPNFVKALKNRHIMYNREKEMIHEKADRGEIFVICPEESLGIPNIERDPDELQRIYDIGRQVATKHLDELKKFLAEDNKPAEK